MRFSHKKTEIEILHHSLALLESEKVIKLHPNLRHPSKAVGLKDNTPRNDYNNIKKKNIFKRKPQNCSKIQKQFYYRHQVNR